MKIIKVEILVCVVLFIHMSLQAQSSNTCKQKLFDYLDTMEQKLMNKHDKVYHVKYTIATEFSKETGIPSSKTTTEILTGKQMLMMQDNKMEVYADNKNVLIVIPKQQKIYWNNSDAEIFENSDTYKKFLEIQRMVLSSAKNVKCNNASTNTLKIEVTPSDDFYKKTKLTKQLVIYNNNLGRVSEVTTIYNRFNKISKQHIEYSVFNFDSNRKIENPISYVFENKKLKNKYKNFQLIDNRQTSN